MKKIFTFLLMALLALTGFKSWGQTDVEIGTGTYSSGNAPFHCFYNYSYAQMLYWGSDIGISGTINSISFNNNTNGTSTVNLNIYMKCVDRDSYSSSSDWESVTNGDLVCSTGVVSFGKGWVTFTLDTPFQYDSSKNLMIAVDNNTGSYSSSYATFKYTSTSPKYTCIYQYSDGTNVDPMNPSSGNSYDANRPNIIINITESGSCPKPKDLAVSNITATGATISWTGSAESYDLAYGVASTFNLENPSTYTLQSGLTTTSVTLSGLTAETEYKCAVKAHCSGDDESAWSSAVAFTPSAKTTLTVNDGTETNDRVPFWGYNADYYNTQSQFIIPANQIENLAGGTITDLTFYVLSPDNKEFTSNQWKVYVKEVDETSVGYAYIDFGSMTEVYSGGLNIVDYKLVVHFNTPYVYDSSKNLMIGFYESNHSTWASTAWLGKNEGSEMRSRGGYGSSNASYTFLPKTTFSYLPGASCASPKGLTASNITATGATITWNGSAESYDVAYGVASTFDLSNPSTYTLQSGLTTTSVQLSGLIAETEYKCAVKAHCSAEDESAWSDAISFLPTDKIIVDFESGIPSDWTLIDNDGDGHNWFISQTYHHSGNNCLQSESYSETTWQSYNADNFFVSPQITLGENASMSFFARSWNNSWKDRVRVQISTTDNNANSFTTTLYDDKPSNNWTEIQIDLSEYEGQNVYIAFRHTDNGQESSFIDDITIDPGETVEKFAITLNQPEDAAVGTISADYEQAAAGTTVTLSTDFNLGYTLNYFMVDEEPIVGNTFEMPEHDVTVSVAYNTLDMYAITFDPEIDNDIISVSATYNGEPVTAAPAGTEITLSYSNLDEGYTFNYWTLNGAQLTGSTFEMPEEDAVIGVNLTERTRYAVAIDSDVQDYITADPSIDILDGTTVTLTISPATGYVLTELHVLDEGENEQDVTITENSNIRTFIMPESNVTVSAVFSRVYNISIDMALVGGSISQMSAQGTLTAYPAGTQVFLFANPDEDYSFVENSFIVIRSDGEIGPTVTYENMMYSFIMPESNVTVSATFNKTAFAVSQVITPLYSGSFTINKTAHVETGETVTLSNFNAGNGYYFDFEDVNSLVVKRNDNHETVEVNNYGNIYQFAMPASDVTVTATFKELPRYSVSVGEVVNGTITVDEPYENILAGTTVYLEANPETDYVLESITVTPEEGESFEPTQQYSYYYFTMPSSNVTISATFRQLQSYTINYYVNGELDRTMQCREDGLVNNDGPQNVAVPAGMTFEGWGVAEIDPYTTEKPAVLGNAETPTQNYDLYAVLSYTEEIPVAKGGETWKKVESTSELSAGDEIVFVYNNLIMCNREDAGFQGYPTTEVTISDNEITSLPNNTAQFTLVDNNGYWKLQYEELGATRFLATSSTSYDLASDDLYQSWSGWGYDVLVNWTAVNNNNSVVFKNDNINNYIGYYSYYSQISMMGLDKACETYKKSASVITNTYYMTSVLADGEVAANTTAKNIIITTGIVTVDNNIVLTMNENGLFRNEDAANFVFEDGAEFIYEGEEIVNATFEKNIVGYNTPGAIGDGWYFIANPTDNPTVNLSGGGSYDLYTFNPAAAAEWQNEQYEDYVQIPENEIEISRETGYLYANSNNFTLRFAGELIPSGEETINLTYAEEGTGIDFPGFNLIGNPFSCTAYISSDFDLYKLDKGSEVQISEDFTMDPCEAFFVEATVDNQEVTISTTAPTGKSYAMPIVVNSDRGETLDRAILHLEGTRNSHKFMMNPDRTNISFAKNGERFASVSRGDETEIPMNFTADHKGSYTISFNTENFEEEYLHLIDVVSGDNIDLLVTPSYTFEADADEYASRFRIVFGTTDINDDPATSSEPFVYISNGNLVINNVEGTASMQIVDMLGRIVRTETVCGSYNKPHNLKAGAYVITLDGRAQRIVIE